MRSFSTRWINFSRTGGDNIQNGEKSAMSTLEKPIPSHYSFRKPVKSDGADVWTLIKKSNTLDLNSSYKYLMWCEFFSDTSVVVEHQDRIVGFVSGFIQPAAPDTLFIWQVAVDESERGQGLATRMLFQLLSRSTCEHVRFLEATVTPSNIPSQQLFLGLADKLHARCQVRECFAADDFPENGHEPEFVYRIGPILN